MPAPPAPRPIRVLHVFGRMDRGGAELRTLDIVRAVDRERFTFAFCTLSGLPGSLDAEIAALGGAVHPCPRTLDFPRRFLRLLQSERVDVVHSHVHHFSGAILALAALAGTRRRIAHFRATIDPNDTVLRSMLYRPPMRAGIARWATDILACGSAVMDAAWSAGWQQDPRCRVIPNGIDPAAFEPPPSAATIAALRAEWHVPEGVPLLLLLGRFDPQKHQRRAPAILARMPGAHLLLVGRPDEEEAAATRQEVERLGLGHRVHFAGERTDVPRLLGAADLLLLTSLAEGLPGAVLEAVAAGTPVLSSDVPGSAEILAALPGAGDLLPLTAPDEVWAATADALVRRGADPAWRAARRRAFAASGFTLPHAVRRHVEVWERARGGEP